MNKNHIITGIPRSGTTLFSSLVASKTKSVVFSEPSWLKTLREQNNSCNSISQSLTTKIKFLRNEIANNQPIKLKVNSKNKLPTNYYDRDDCGNIVIIKGEQNTKLGLDYSNAPFYIKSNAQFTSCLPELIINTNIDKIFCIIRNPISCIMSWRSLDIPVSKGNLKIAEKYSLDYFKFVSDSLNLIHKQVMIIEWFFKTYQKHSNSIVIIKYEDMVNDTRVTLNNALGLNIQSASNLISKNKSKYYDLKELEIIRNTLLKYGHYYKQYYPNLDVD